MHPLAPLDAPVAPGVALRRIAFLLERSGAGTYRVEAFRKAAAVLLEMSDADLTERIEADTLTELPGIGSTTATVIAQAAAGDLPEYLAAQQAKAPDLVSGGEALYAALKGDCHLHSDWSDGGSPIDEMVLAAAELGHSWIALTDHSPSLRVANGLSVERLTRQIELLDAINAQVGDSIRVLCGIEVDILADGSLDQTEEILNRLDVVTASVHSKLKMPAPEMTARMIAAVRHPRVTVLGHATGRLVTGSRGTRPQSAFDAPAVFAACAEAGTAVEINSRPERCDPPDDLIEIARDLGCYFAIDSDAHAPGQLDMKAYGCARAEKLGIPAERIITTWEADALLEWSGR